MVEIQLLVTLTELVNGSIVARDIGDVISVSEETAERLCSTGQAVRMLEQAAEPVSDTKTKRTYRRSS